MANFVIMFINMSYKLFIRRTEIHCEIAKLNSQLKYNLMILVYSLSILRHLQNILLKKQLNYSYLKENCCSS